MSADARLGQWAGTSDRHTYWGLWSWQHSSFPFRHHLSSPAQAVRRRRQCRDDGQALGSAVTLSLTCIPPHYQCSRLYSTLQLASWVSHPTDSTNTQQLTPGQNPTSSVPRNQRVPLIQGLIDTITPDFNKTSGLFNRASFCTDRLGLPRTNPHDYVVFTITQSGSFMAAAANSELITNSTKNRNVVLDGINTYLSFATNGGFNSLWVACCTATTRFCNINELLTTLSGVRILYTLC